MVVSRASCLSLLSSLLLLLLLLFLLLRLVLTLAALYNRVSCNLDAEDAASLKNLGVDLQVVGNLELRDVVLDPLLVVKAKARQLGGSAKERDERQRMKMMLGIVMRM